MVVCFLEFNAQTKYLRNLDSVIEIVFPVRITQRTMCVNTFG